MVNAWLTSVTDGLTDRQTDFDIKQIHTSLGCAAEKCGPLMGCAPWWLYVHAVSDKLKILGLLHWKNIITRKRAIAKAL